MALRQLDHYNILTSRPEETIAFYCDVLGCVNIPERRPDFGQPGAWLFVDDHPAVHINYVDEDPAADTGAFHHVAFEASGYLELCQRFDDLGIDYRAVESPALDLMQIFVKDPNQVRVELNIRGEADEVAAARAAP